MAGASHSYQSPAAARFRLSDDEVHDDVPLSPNGNQAPQQAVFNLDLDYSDDDALLDWEQYAGMNRVRCCGIDCSPLARHLRPPQWWHTYTKRQRRCILVSGACLALLLVALLGVLAAAAVHGAGSSAGLAPASPGSGTAAGEAAGAGAVGGGGGGGGDEGEVPLEELELCGWAQWRLPTAVAPTHYNLTLELASLDGKAPVEGSVSIAVEAAVATRCVVLHAAEMQVTEARLGGPEGDAGTLQWREDAQQLVLRFGRPLPRGSGAAVLWLRFSYPLRAGMSGFYRSTYLGQDGRERGLAATQFEANSARLAFPCFDEPSLKAEFAVEVIAPKGLQVLSNMPPRAVHQHAHNTEHGTRTWHFEPTPRMSSYLVCVVVGEFASTSRVVQAGAGSVNVSVWGTPDRVDQLGFAADSAAAALRGYEAALGVPYPLPKLDLIAVPDFSAGAMENWGAITYRETALLVSSTSSVLDRRYVGFVVAHELAHQWFGNLVTMDYWSELWLNEGFASYLEYLGAAAADPEGAPFSTFYSDYLPRALALDAKRSSHALSMDAAVLNSSDTVEGMFDEVSYQKGAAVLRMLRAWANRRSKHAPPPTHETGPGLTPDKDPFLKALRFYLTAHAYHTAQAEDLWAQMKGTLAFDVPKAMARWTYSQGYPVVSATLDAKGHVYLRQAPFGLDGVGTCRPDDAWWIPISYVTSDDPQTLRWAELSTCASEKPLLTLKDAGSWIKLNAGQSGFYRVAYAGPSNDTHLQALVAAARAPAGSGSSGADGSGMLLPGADVAGLLEDSWALAQAEEGSIAHFLDLLRALEARPAGDFAPWGVALPYVYQLDRLLASSCRSDWQAWVLGLLQTFLRQAPGVAAGSGGGANATAAGTQLLFSFSPEGGSVPAEQRSIGYRLLRPAILKAAGLFKEPRVVSEAVNLMAALEPPEVPAAAASRRPPNTIEPDVRSAVYAAAVRADGSREVFGTLQELYLEARDADERERLLLSLGYAAGGSNVQATLQFSLSPDVRAQDVRSLIVTTAANGGPDAAGQAWDWLQQSWDALHTKLGGDDEASRRLAQAAEGVASLFADPAREAEVDALLARAKQQDPSYAARTKESIAANARFVKNSAPEACAWLREQRGGAGSG